jgi:acyl carrier protein
MLARDLDATVRDVLARHLDMTADQFTADIDLQAAGLDDDTAMVVLEDVEDALEIRFPDDFFDGLTTYADLTAAVRVAVGA